MCIAAILSVKDCFDLHGISKMLSISILHVLRLKVPRFPFLLPTTMVINKQINIPFDVVWFSDWKIVMTIALFGKKKLGFVDDTFKQHESNSSFIKLRRGLLILS